MQASPHQIRRARWLLLALATALVLGGLLLWRHTPLRELTDPQQVTGWLRRVGDTPGAVAAVIAIYVVAGLIEFPIVLLIGATAAVFEPARAVLLAFAGSLASATVFYFVGQRFMRGAMRDALGPALTRAEAALRHSGIVAVVVVRSIPIAPFTVVNLAAGSIGVRLRDYLIGTAVGLAPGILMLTAFGDQLRSLWQDRTPANVGKLLGIALAWIALIVLLQRMSSRWRTQRAPPA